MIRKLVLATSIVASCTTFALAAPTLSVIPQGLQGGNWVWEVDITPDLVLASGSSTPLATELGFRLAGDPLVSVTSLSPLVFDTNNPGLFIFGWEVPYADGNNHPEGIEANCTSCSITNLALNGHPTTVVPGSTNEVFTALGSLIVTDPGPIPYLKIVALGPANGGPSTSTVQWLGAYNGQGEIAQEIGGSAGSFFYAGTASQSVPEPASAALFACAAIGSLLTSRRRAVR